MIDSELESQITKIVEKNGYFLYDIEVLRENDAHILRISITSKNGINHNDCQKINDLISPLLDVYDPIDGEYFLEISSPGLERILKKPNHFKLSIGDTIEIKLLDKTKIIGILKESDDNGFYLDSTYYKYSDIKKAKSVFIW
ncbi:ribosome maturation factor RimP [Helicobacter sp. MIT 99-5507]|uniref:ribosome maturation factor RimP n=1 Tax=Helicobacter sp. MIT 99-5507 TaxID=152489 RepID=UPI000E1F5908|nr:ribosome maturation factor RimP [Helicobacter sp. MIT 99-5507]RDU57594.1 ribosome maturation factor [Helicobacter sp. MIT 99-5507]